MPQLFGEQVITTRLIREKFSVSYPEKSQEGKKEGHEDAEKSNGKGKPTKEKREVGIDMEEAIGINQGSMGFRGKDGWEFRGGRSLGCEMGLAYSGGHV